MVKVLGLIVLLILVLGVPLAGVPTASAQPTDITQFIKDTDREPKNLDPAWAYDNASGELLMNVYESLVWFNRTDADTFMSMLATEWHGEIIGETSPEGLEWAYRWAFKIRDNVRFHYHDGSFIGENATLTPQDVEYTFERMLITDHSPGPAPKFWRGLTGGYSMDDLNNTLTMLGWPINVTTSWNTKCDEAVDHAIESNATHVWFNLVTPCEPWLQTVARWGFILNQEWCVWHGDWPGMAVSDSWTDYYDPVTSPLYSSNPSSASVPNLDAALGTGPYMLDYWNKGAGNAWSVTKNNNYWRGWAVPYSPSEWGTPPVGGWIQGHVDRFTCNYFPEWFTKKFRFLGGLCDFCEVPCERADQVEGYLGIRCIYVTPTEIHCERDWICEWYYNPSYPGIYAYDIWKVFASWAHVDVAVASLTAVAGFEIGAPIGENMITLFPSVDVNIVRLDMDNNAPGILVVIGVGVRRETTGSEIIITIDDATLGVAGGGSDTYTAHFDSLEPDPDSPLQPGNYTVFAEILVDDNFAVDDFPANDKLDNGAVEADVMVGDINVDSSIDMLDISLLIDCFMTYPGHPDWDIRGDIIVDHSIDMADISWDIDLFMVSFC